MIFLFIAGSYTPVAVLAMDRPTAEWVLAVVWTGALAGVALKTLWPYAPAWVGVPIYVAETDAVELADLRLPAGAIRRDPALRRPTSDARAAPRDRDRSR